MEKKKFVYEKKNLCGDWKGTRTARGKIGHRIKKLSRKKKNTVTFNGRGIDIYRNQDYNYK